MLNISERKLPRSAYTWNSTPIVREIRLRKKKKKEKVTQCICGTPTKNPDGVCVICCIGIRMRANYDDVEDLLKRLGVH